LVADKAAEAAVMFGVPFRVFQGILQFYLKNIKNKSF
jgi:hypothetical protein